MKYFSKEIIQTPVHGPAGKAVVWDKLAQNKGVIQLADDDPQVPFLEALIQKHVGGVTAITAEQYEDLKKNLPFVPKAPKERLRLVSMEPPNLRRKPSSPAPQQATALPSEPPDPLKEHVRAAMGKVRAANAEVAEPAAGAEAAVGSDYFKPKTGRPKPEKKVE